MLKRKELGELMNRHKALLDDHSRRLRTLVSISESVEHALTRTHTHTHAHRLILI